MLVRCKNTRAKPHKASLLGRIQRARHRPAPSTANSSPQVAARKRTPRQSNSLMPIARSLFVEAFPSQRTGIVRRRCTCTCSCFCNWLIGVGQRLKGPRKASQLLLAHQRVVDEQAKHLSQGARVPGANRRLCLLTARRSLLPSAGQNKPTLKEGLALVES